MSSGISAAGYPVPGARIGRFRIVEQLGQGGMGVVFRAVEENLGREVALKVIAPHFAHDPDFRERFTREARAQASLESSHVVAVYAHGEEDGYLYIASQLVQDGDLGQLIKSLGVPPMVDALEVIEQVASGLADAHDAGLVHRDIKPGNVLVRIRGRSVRAYLADFGIARRVDADATRFSSSAVGTPSYMAPELHGGAPASVATDIYSLGCLLWVALTGNPPYQGTTEYQIVGAHVTQPVPQLSGTSAMAQATNRILRIAMAKEAAQRYHSAAAMRADLQAALRLPSTPGQQAVVADRGAATALRPPTPSGGPSGGASGGPGGSSGPRTPTGRPPSRPPTAPPAGPPPGPPSPHGFAGPAQPPPARSASPGGAPPSRRRTALLVAVSIAAVLALAIGIVAALVTNAGGGGGSDDPSSQAAVDEFAALSAEEILEAAEKEMKVLDTVHVEGQFDDEGQVVLVDVVVTSAGSCEGTMSLQTGGSTELRSVGGRVYMKPDEQFWDTTTAEGTYDLVQQFVGDKWIEITDPGDSFTAFCDLDELFEGDGIDEAELTKEGEEEILEQPSVKLTQSNDDGSTSTVWVKADEPHYLLRVDESETDHFEYSDFDLEVDITAPTADEVIKDNEIGE